MSFASVLTDPLAASFRTAAGLGALYELSERLLADKIAGFNFSSRDSFSDVCQKVVKRFDGQLSAEEKILLESALRIRNKLLHADLSEAKDLVSGLGHKSGAGRVLRVALPPLEQLTVATFTTAIDMAVPLEDTPAKGSLLGWLAQLNADGTLSNAGTVFENAIRVIDRLALTS